MLKKLGPGLLFAGAAVGVSHLVYATKAGALEGWGLVWAVVLAHVCKYPFFELGPRYAGAKSQSLLEGYRELGPWALRLFLFMTLGTMFTVQAAVTVVAASLATQIFGGGLEAWFLGLMSGAGLLVWRGRYVLLDQSMKWIIIGLSLLSLVAFTLAWGSASPPPSSFWAWPQDAAGYLFLVALMGWMPAPLDLSVWHSLWALEKQGQNQDQAPMQRLQQGLFDFRVGYIGTAILALIFLGLGALQWYGRAEAIPPSATGFAAALIELYRQSLGDWVGQIIAWAALITMLSTVLTCLDALPRSLSRWQALSQGRDFSQRAFGAWLALLMLGSSLLFLFFFQNFSSFLALATALSFLTAPVFAWLNLRLMYRLESASRPAPWQFIWAYLGLVYLLLFCGLYLWTLTV